MAKLAVLKFEDRFNTGGDTGEIAISPTFFLTYVVLGEDNRCVGTLPRVRSSSSSSSLVVSRDTSPQVMPVSSI